MKEDNKSLDRVSYSFGMKVNVGNYESKDVHCSLSSDVKPGESTQDAFGRVAFEVIAEVVERVNALKNPEKAAPTEAKKSAEAITKKEVKPEIKKTKPQGTKNTIEAAFKVLKAQGKETGESFKKTFLNGNKLSELKQNDIDHAIALLRVNHPQLGEL